MRVCCVQRVGTLKRCLQRQIFTEVFVHDIFMCASGCISHSQRRETDLYIPDEMNPGNADLCIPDEMNSASNILVPKTKLSAVFY